MARISKYKFDEKITKEDFVIGSDGLTKATRNYRLESLVDFFRGQGLGSSGFSYEYTATGENYNILTKGQFTIPFEQQSETLFSNITKIYININNTLDQSIYSFLQALAVTRSGIAMYYSENLVNFGYFKLLSINIVSENVISIDVEPKITNGGFESGKQIMIESAYIPKTKLGELEDVVLTDLVDNQLISYNAQSDTWVNTDELFVKTIDVEGIAKSGAVFTGIVIIPKTFTANIEIPANSTGEVGNELALEGEIAVGENSELIIIN